MNAIQKLLSGLKHVLQKTKYFKGFDSKFTELHAKFDGDTLLNFAIHHRQNETRSRKSTHVKAESAHSSVMWHMDAIGFQKCDFGLPSHLSQRQLQQ
jgi:hypothetical protein